MEPLPAGRSVGEGFTPKQEEEDRVWQTGRVKIQQRVSQGWTPRRKSAGVIATVGLLEEQTAVSMSSILSSNIFQSFHGKIQLVLC